MTDDEKRAYARGYQAGQKRRQRQALMDRIYVAVLASLVGRENPWRRGTEDIACLAQEIAVSRRPYAP